MSPKATATSPGVRPTSSKGATTTTAPPAWVGMRPRGRDPPRSCSAASAPGSDSAMVSGRASRSESAAAETVGSGVAWGVEHGGEGDHGDERQARRPGRAQRGEAGGRHRRRNDTSGRPAFLLGPRVAIAAGGGRHRCAPRRRRPGFRGRRGGSRPARLAASSSPRLARHAAARPARHELVVVVRGTDDVGADRHAPAAPAAGSEPPVTRRSARRPRAATGSSSARRGRARRGDAAGRRARCCGARRRPCRAGPPRRRPGDRRGRRARAPRRRGRRTTGRS